MHLSVVRVMFYLPAGGRSDVADYLIGLVVERLWPQASLVIFLVLYFVFLWVAWLLAVRITRPKGGEQVARLSRPSSRLIRIEATDRHGRDARP